MNFNLLPPRGLLIHVSKSDFLLKSMGGSLLISTCSTSSWISVDWSLRAKLGVICILGCPKKNQFETKMTWSPSFVATNNQWSRLPGRDILLGGHHCRAAESDDGQGPFSRWSQRAKLICISQSEASTRWQWPIRGLNLCQDTRPLA